MTLPNIFTKAKGSTANSGGDITVGNTDALAFFQANTNAKFASYERAISFPPTSIFPPPCPQAS